MTKSLHKVMHIIRIANFNWKTCISIKFFMYIYYDWQFYYFLMFINNNIRTVIGKYRCIVWVWFECNKLYYRWHITPTLISRWVAITIILHKSTKFYIYTLLSLKSIENFILRPTNSYKNMNDMNFYMKQCLFII